MPACLSPMGARYSARSSGGSTAISASSFADIAHVEHRDRAQELEHVERLLLLGRALDQAGWLAVAQEGERSVDQVERRLGFQGVAITTLRFLGEIVDAL